LLHPHPVVQLNPKAIRLQQFRCCHCLTYTAVNNFNVRHIRKTYNITESADQDLMLINEAVPVATMAAVASNIRNLKLEQILNSVKA